MNIILRFIFLLVLCGMLSACSIVTYDKQFFPIVRDDKALIYSDIEMGAHTIFDTTPKEKVTIQKPDLRLEIDVYNTDTFEVSAGPLYFPVIPTFPFQILMDPIYNAFKKKPDIYDNMIIGLSAHRNSFDSKWDFKCDLRKIKILLSNGKAVEPLEYTMPGHWMRIYDPKESIIISNQPIVNGFSVRPTKMGFWEVRLLFPIPVKTTEKFTLIFDDAFLCKTKNGSVEPILIPDIDYEWDSGFRMIIGP